MSTQPGWPQQPDQSSGVPQGGQTPSASSPYAPGDPNATQQFPAQPAAGSYGQPPAGEGYGQTPPPPAGYGQTPPAGGYGQTPPPGGYGPGYGGGGSGYGGGGYGGGYQPQPPKKNNSALIAIAVAAVALIALAAIFLPRLLRGDPTTTAAPSPTATQTTTAPSPTEAPSPTPTETTTTAPSPSPTVAPSPTVDPNEPLQIGTKSVFDIAPGDCMLYVDVDMIPNEMPLYDCDSPHDAEVFAEFSMTDAAYPGEEATQTQAEEYCLSQFEPYVGTPYDSSSLYLYYYYPTDGTWNSSQQDRLITCIVYDLAYYRGLLENSNR